jgi:uncharacterized protein YndB with AHSA1/START domain
MSEPTVNLTNISDQKNGNAAPNWLDWPQFPHLKQVEKDIPRLHVPASRTLIRDRWERLVTSIDIPASPKEVWKALTDSAALKLWLAACHGSLEQIHRDCVLDFEDGEFFLCRSTVVEPPQHLHYLWRWLGIGQATSVTWRLEETELSTRVTVTEEAFNPPWDWQTWNGGGWPGILDQLAAYLRTGTQWRWPWRRMGPYAQIEIPISIYEAWDRLFNPSGLRFWLQAMHGSMLPEQSLIVMMGDASGLVEMKVREVVQPGQAPPSFLPYVTFSLNRPIWKSEVAGRLWIEPAGWEHSIFQAFHYNWENLPAELQLSERRILTSFWAGAMRRARLMCGERDLPIGPHSWT